MIPCRVLITAGPTHEPIDRVRYVANRSSGRMGVALAQASLSRNWPTTLLLGPSSISVPNSSQLTTIRFQTTEELRGLLRENWPNHDLLLMAAAVADFRPVDHSGVEKLRRGNDNFSLEFEPTPDLLAEVSKQNAGGFIVGFALEPSQDLHERARKKLIEKGIDAIVANPIETIGSDSVSATVLFRGGAEIKSDANLPKLSFANWLLDSLESHMLTSSPSGRGP